MFQTIADKLSKLLRNILPAPEDISEILSTVSPEPNWLITGLLLGKSNTLIAGAPKSHKTHFGIEMAVALATGTPFLERYSVPRSVRVGVVEMEGVREEVARTFERVCNAHDLSAESLREKVYYWHRPPLRLGDRRAMADLARWTSELEIDVLILDPFCDLSDGDVDKSHLVRDQLMAVSGLQTVRPDLTVIIVHHTRRVSGRELQNLRIADLARNSTVLGGWYDQAVLLAKPRDEGPTEMRVELRAIPSPSPVTLVVEDEFPGDPDEGIPPSGYLRIAVASQTTSPTSPAAAARTIADDSVVQAVVAAVTRSPGLSKTQLRAAVRKTVHKRNEAIDAAILEAERCGLIRVERGDALRPDCHFLPEVHAQAA